MLLAGCQLASQGGGSAGADAGVAEGTTTTGESSLTLMPSTSGVGELPDSGETSGVSTGTPTDDPTTSVDETGEDTDETGTGERPLPPPPPFVDVTLAPNLGSDQHDFGPTLRSDLLEIYFVSDRYNDLDIFVATRVSTDQPWGLPQLVYGGVSTLANETHPELSPDGLALAFSSDRDSDDYEVYFIVRDNVGGLWSQPEVIPSLGSPGQEFALTAQADAQTVLFCSDRSPSDGIDVWRVLFDGARHSEPERLQDLASPGTDCPGTSSGDMTWLAMGSDRAGGMGDSDLWIAQQTESGEGYWPPHNLAELNTTAAERDPWVSEDLGVIYFASDRSGDLEIYQARAQR